MEESEHQLVLVVTEGSTFVLLLPYLSEIHNGIADSIYEVVPIDYGS